LPDADAPAVRAMTKPRSLHAAMLEKPHELPSSADGPLPETRFVTGPFAFAVLALLVAVVLAWPVSAWFQLHQVKRPLPLRYSLGDIGKTAFAPYQEIHREILDSVIVEALDTQQYLLCTLENPSEPEKSPLRFANLFVTYYTGGNHLVPHTPDVCYLGAGYEPSQAHENRELEVASLGPAIPAVPVRVCTFAKTSLHQKDEFTVVYTFFANGTYAATRNRVRVLLNDLRNVHAFFSKTEMSFFAGRVEKNVPIVERWADRAESVRGARQMLDGVLPVLMERYWPDFEAAEQRARGGSSSK